MVGSLKSNPPQLVTPEEAVKLSLAFSGVDTAAIAMEIAKEYYRCTPDIKDGLFKLGFLYSTLYEAGRLQGIREERRRRKPRVSTLQA